MKPTTIPPAQFASISSLLRQPARKEKTSITLSGGLLQAIDIIAGTAQRSAWIERAVRAYAKRELRRQQEARELQLLNKHAATLNAEAEDSIQYQAPWSNEEE